MMGVIRIENRGKNLIKGVPNVYRNAGFGVQPYGYGVLITEDANGMLGWSLKLKPNQTYAVTFTVSGTLQLKVYEQDFPFTNLNTDIASSITQVDATDETKSFTFTPTKPYVWIGVYAGGSVAIPGSILSNIQLEEGSSATDYEPPRNDYIEFDGEMFGMNGIYDELHDDGTLIKRWQRESITITAGSGTVSKTGTGTCILVADSDGVPYDGTVSGTSVTTGAPDGTYTIIYQLATPEISKIPIHSTMKALGSGHNQFLATKYDKDTFTGDGVTTTFNLSKTANSTNYSVKVNGVEITEGITKNTTSVVFDTAPRNGAIIEVYYNATPETLWCAAIKVYEPSGTQETLSQFTELSITENDDVVTAKFDDGTFKKVVKSRDFTVTLNKALIENAENFIQKYRDKKFRMIITNSRDSSVEYVAMCEFDTSRSKNYMDGSENITIRCTDLYD